MRIGTASPFANSKILLVVSSAASLTKLELEEHSSSAAANMGTTNGSACFPTICARALRKRRHPSLASGGVVNPFLESEMMVEAASLWSVSIEPIDARLTADVILRIPPPGLSPFSLPNTAAMPFGTRFISIFSITLHFFSIKMTPFSFANVARSAAAALRSIELDAFRGAAIPALLPKSAGAPSASRRMSFTFSLKSASGSPQVSLSASGSENMFGCRGGATPRLADEEVFFFAAAPAFFVPAVTFFFTTFFFMVCVVEALIEIIFTLYSSIDFVLCLLSDRFKNEYQ
mmetsp:Transcript_12113/g.18400  ORF Transcript_12113/g.18400 Transcript_12113/m.18400 type:complete len:289 (+) Transcript_12113:949-1815(+)